MSRPMTIVWALMGSILVPAVTLAQTEVHSGGETAAGQDAASTRMIVHLEKRSFDLEDLRLAIRAKRNVAQIDAIIARYDRQMQRDQTNFAARVRAMGGHTYAQWWIVNACAIEIPCAAVGDVQRLPNVDLIEPDEVVYATIGQAHNKYNHNVDALHALGADGNGVTVAIVDSGQNTNVPTVNRPHRTYYPGGNPNNNTGPGIGGSRLLFNKQIGALPADAVPYHGLSVSAIAAGGHWGTPGAHQGVAFGANLAGYAIADMPNAGTRLSTITTAWQTVLADQAAHGIVTANFSYSSSPNPLNASQKAMDMAAYCGDIMIVVSAGNQGPGRTSQATGGANVIAVAALNLDTHTVWPGSSGGPLNGDPGALLSRSVGRLGCDCAGVGLRIRPDDLQRDFVRRTKRVRCGNGVARGRPQPYCSGDPSHSPHIGIRYQCRKPEPRSQSIRDGDAPCRCGLCDGNRSEPVSDPNPNR